MYRIAPNFRQLKFSSFSSLEKINTQKLNNLYGSHLFLDKLTKILTDENFELYGKQLTRRYLPSTPWEYPKMPTDFTSNKIHMVIRRFIYLDLHMNLT